MDSRKTSFLQAVIGQDGARALTKATDKSPDLEWALLPRVIMSWLEVMAHGEYDGAVPGSPDTALVFKKTEGKFTGRIAFDDENYAFRNVSLDHVAGSVAVALGADTKAPGLKSPALANLGKSVDLLVKSRTVRKIQEMAKAAMKAPKAPSAGTGAAAGAKGPTGPTAPTVPSMKQQAPKAVAGASGTKTASSTPKATGANAKKPTLKVTKAEAATKCGVCGERQFKASRYVGCTCFEELAKSVKTTATASGYVLEFGADWDSDAVWTVVESLKGE